MSILVKQLQFRPFHGAAPQFFHSLPVAVPCISHGLLSRTRILWNAGGCCDGKWPPRRPHPRWRISSVCGLAHSYFGRARERQGATGSGGIAGSQDRCLAARARCAFALDGRLFRIVSSVGWLGCLYGRRTRNAIRCNRAFYAVVPMVRPRPVLVDARERDSP